MMYFSRAIPRKEIWHSLEFLPQIKNSYDVHKQVWNFFLGDSDKKRDFLYRYEIHNGLPVIYLVSVEKPISQHGIWILESKEYNPQISNGDVLAFSVRVNPVVTRTVVDKTTGVTTHKRHDVVMDCKHRCRMEGKSFSYGDAITETGTSWLSSQGEKHGFTISAQSVLPIRYERKSFEKISGNGSKHEVTLGIMELSGQLKVTDADAFVQMLYQGLGPAKGFGCGLMMVKHLSV